MVRTCIIFKKSLYLIIPKRKKSVIERWLALLYFGKILYKFLWNMEEHFNNIFFLAVLTFRISSKGVENHRKLCNGNISDMPVLWLNMVQVWLGLQEQGLRRMDEFDRIKADVQERAGKGETG